MPLPTNDTHFDCLDWFVTVWPTIVSDSSEEQNKRLLQLADDMVNDAVIPLPSEYPEQLTKSSTNAEWSDKIMTHLKQKAQETGDAKCLGVQ
ncbi:unnamed protein product [Peronospora destructor]|uniref:Uncharacterized protein n=1 Tax=Peronospora destructor TaxID=86335 RepID=A0AAV0V5L4_9STRA|nr:unnamed protein product [Peronospora destructor]